MIFNVSGGGSVLPKDGAAGQVLTKTATGTAWAKAPGQPRNLLDNSDFRNPVNQRGQTTYTSDYGFDRWRIYSESASMVKKDGYITITGSGIWQNVPDAGDKVYTLAGKKTNGTVYCVSGKFENGVATPGGELVFNFATTAFNSVMIAAGDWLWVALYEGEYTIDTLPEYQPKGYGAELLECSRFYVPRTHEWDQATMIGASGFFIRIVCPIEMRILPSAIVSNLQVYIDGWENTSVKMVIHRGAGVYDVNIDETNLGTENGKSYLIRGFSALSADL